MALVTRCALAVCLASLATLALADVAPTRAFTTSSPASSSTSSSSSSLESSEQAASPDIAERAGFYDRGFGSGGFSGFSSEASSSSSSEAFDDVDPYNGGNSRGFGGRGPSYGPGSGGRGGRRGNPLRLEYAWKSIDFAFPTRAMRDEYTRTGKYNSSSIIPLDVDVWQKGGRQKVFVTMPTGDGSPVALGTVSSEGEHGSHHDIHHGSHHNSHQDSRHGSHHGSHHDSSRAPLIAPYPDWSWYQQQGDCLTTINSVYRVAIDDFDRLWVLDSGDSAKRCQPKLLAFDLDTDKLLSQFEFQQSLIRDDSDLVTPVVDARDFGRNVFVYIADTAGGIIVYDHQRRDAWRVNHPLTQPEQRHANHTIAGSNFFLADGVFGMALRPWRCDGRHRFHHCDTDRTLYFHALASLKENYVKTSVLRNKDNFPDGQNRASSAFKSFDRTRKSQSAAQAMSDDGVLFSGLLPDLAVTCWDSRQSFGGRNLEVVASDAETLQFTSGLKVRYGRLYVFSCRYQRFATGTLDWNEVNYRVQSARVSDLIRGTKCDPKANSIGFIAL